MNLATGGINGFVRTLHGSTAGRKAEFLTDGHGVRSLLEV